MIKYIENEQPFQIIDGSAAFTLPEGNYTLYISADGINYTQKGDAITGPDTVVLANAPEGLYVKISGIADKISVLL